MSARTGRPARFSAALVVVGYIGSWSAVSAAPTPPRPETAATARTRAELTRNREALRKVIAAQAHGTPAKHPIAVNHGALAATNAAARHGASAGPNVLEARGPLAAGAIPGHAVATTKPGTIGTVQASLSRPRIAPAAGTLGGALASNTLTPFHRSPAAPVILGGAPARRNAGYSAIDGSVFHHKP